MNQNPDYDGTGTRYFLMETDEVLRELGTSPEGLEISEAERRLEEYGPNAIRQEDAIDHLKIILNQVKSPLIFILAIAGAVTLLMGDLKDTAVIAAVILLNGVIGYVQEVRAEQSVRSLKQMVNPKAHVLRSGRETEVPSESVVPGDVVQLVSGTMVPADLRLMQTIDLKIDESMLTGESVPSEKMNRKLEDPSLSLGDRTNLAFMGTVVVSGRATAVVVRTGSGTELGTIAEDISQIGVVRAPIQDKINRFAHKIGYVVLGAAILVFGAGVAVGESMREMFMTAVAAAVATVPEGMPIVVTIAMAVGVRRMARSNAIVRKLAAVETLGSTTVICSDKTGTLTVNQMTVRHAYNGADLFVFEGEGYDPVGEVTVNREKPSEEQCQRLEELMRIGLLCNESRLIRRDDRWEVHGDPTEVALIVAARKAGLDPEVEAREYPQVALLPFESDRGYMATLHRHDGRKIVFVKGGHDRLMEICDQCPYTEGLNHPDISEQSRMMAERGERVLLFAYKEVDPDTTTLNDEDLRSGLIFVGMQGMIDPPRPEAILAVADCASSGIRTVMITGDHAATAAAIAERMGIAEKGARAVTGGELAAMGEEEFARVVREVNVFARIAPQQKFKIVEELKEQGETVAVTGDGVNDSLALRAAHIGIAMGKGGTDVAREASDMVLADDNFASIFQAVVQGRIVFDNLRKVVFFLLPTGIAAIWTILLTQILGYPLPYLPAQLLWINLVTNGLQDVAMAFEKGEAGVEKRKPRGREEGVMTPLLTQRTLLVSLAIAAGVVALFKLSEASGASIEKSRTVAVTTMVMFQFFQALNARSEHRSIFAMNPLGNPFLAVSLGLAMLAQLAFVYWGPLQRLFETTALTANDWTLITATALGVVFVVEADKLLRRTFAGSGAGPGAGSGAGMSAGSVAGGK